MKISEVFTMIAEIQKHYQLVFVFDNLTNELSIKIWNRSNLERNYSASLDNDSEVEELINTLKYYEEPATGASGSSLYPGMFSLKLRNFIRENF